MEIIHQDNGQKGAFVLKDGDSTAGEVSYVWAGDKRVILDRTHVEREYGGQGLGKKLVDAVAGFARDKEIKIVPRCSYAEALFNKSSSYDDVKSV
ncbi:MAG: N-acetyltransferase [Candidatus Accumulibacter sp.]|nr:N-acetyltransferase [Accumulibacter sp.]